MLILMVILKILVGTAIVAGVVYGGIRLLDPPNDKNSLFMAVFSGVGFSLMGICGSFFALLPIIAMLYLFINYYNVGMVKSFAITAAMGFLYFGAMIVMNIVEAAVTH